MQGDAICGRGGHAQLPQRRAVHHHRVARRKVLNQGMGKAVFPLTPPGQGPAPKTGVAMPALPTIERRTCGISGHQGAFRGGEFRRQPDIILIAQGDVITIIGHVGQERQEIRRSPLPRPGNQTDIQMRMAARKIADNPGCVVLRPIVGNDDPVGGLGLGGKAF